MATGRLGGHRDPEPRPLSCPRSDCDLTIAKPAGSRTYVAEIAKPNGSQVQASSPPVTVTWQ